MIILLIGLFAGFGPAPSLLGEESPWKTGTTWTYQNSDGGTERTVLGIAQKIRLYGKEVSAKRILFFGRQLFLVEREGETWLVEETVLGKGGPKGNVPVAVFRWEGDAKWGFSMQSGCFVWSVSCRREGAEKIRIGTEEVLCTRFQIGSETWWLSPDKGIIKYTRYDGVWTLQRTAKHFHRCGTRLVCWPCGIDRSR